MQSRKSVISNIFLLITSLFVAFGVCEISLRVFPIRGIITRRAVFDPQLGYTRAAGTTNRYITNAGKVVIKKTNKIGYFDKDHDKAKKGYRIGFFGDSFVESLQVPFDNTFFHLIEKKLKDLNVECLAFGRSGYGALHSYMECKRWMDYFDLDMVVYAFFENDLGDQVKEIKQRPDLLYVHHTQDGYEIQVPVFVKQKSSRFYRVIDAIRSHSVLLINISARIGLLLERGVSLKADEKDLKMATKNMPGHYPNVDDLPSTWPEDIKRNAMNLAELVMTDFRDYVVKSNKRFTILYIPRPGEYHKSMDMQDSWKAWLVDFCEREKVDLVDPTDALIKYTQKKGEVFSDHFTKIGHEAVAELFVDWYRNSRKTR